MSIVLFICKKSPELCVSDDEWLNGMETVYFCDFIEYRWC